MKKSISKILKTIFKKGSQVSNNKVSEWINSVLTNKVVPENICGFCFNLYEEINGFWSMELVATESFDLNDEDWACDEITDFGSRENLFRWQMECNWDEALSYMVNELKLYLLDGKYAELLKSKEGIGVGFVDGNILVLYSK